MHTALFFEWLAKLVKNLRKKKNSYFSTNIGGVLSSKHVCPFPGPIGDGANHSAVSLVVFERIRIDNFVERLLAVEEVRVDLNPPNAVLVSRKAGEGKGSGRGGSSISSKRWGKKQYSKVKIENMPKK